MRKHRAASPLAVFAVLAILASACGGAAQPSPTASAAPSPTKSAAATASASPAAKPGELDKATIDAAKKEGAVVFYTSLSGDDSKIMVDTFMKAYPEIKVTLNRKSSEKITTQYLTEAKAGKVLADVLETGGIDVAKAINEGLTVAFDPPAAADWPKDYKQANGHFTAARVGAETIAWNTTLVKAGEEPKSFDDLTDPKWKGKLLVEATDVEVMLALAKRKWNGDDAKVREYFTKLMANSPKLIDGHTDMNNALIAGEGAVAWGAHGHTAQDAIQKKKAPLGWLKAEVVLTIDGPVISKAAPHPNAAKLFVNWYLTKTGGQKVLADRARIPAAPGVADKAFMFTKTYVSGPQFLGDFAKYQKLWDELVTKK